MARSVRRSAGARKTVKRTAEPKPAGRSGGFKDPFSDAAPPRARARRSMVALSDDASAKQLASGSQQGRQLGAL